MMKISSLFLAILFAACTSNNPNHNQAAADSLQQAKIASLRQDSLVKATENVALSPVKFGISKKEFARIAPRVYNQVGSNLYSFHPQFSSNKLTQLTLQSNKCEAGKTNSRLREQAYNIEGLFEKQYGKPSSDLDFPDYEKLEIGLPQWFKSWQLGSKQIKIGLQHLITNDYVLVCQISEK